MAQLNQTIFTATEFKEVDQVRILINGELSDYLGGDGLFIGKGLTRETFYGP